jgi:hypothetical protein
VFSRVCLSFVIGGGVGSLRQRQKSDETYTHTQEEAIGFFYPGRNL